MLFCSNIVTFFHEKYITCIGMSNALIHEVNAFGTRDVNRKPEILFSALKPKTCSISLAVGFLFFHFHQGNYIKIIKCQIKLILTFV